MKIVQFGLGAAFNYTVAVCLFLAGFMLILFFHFSVPIHTHTHYLCDVVLFSVSVKWGLCELNARSDVITIAPPFGQIDMAPLDLFNTITTHSHSHSDSHVYIVEWVHLCVDPSAYSLNIFVFVLQSPLPYFTVFPSLPLLQLIGWTSQSV